MSIEKALKTIKDILDKRFYKIIEDNDDHIKGKRGEDSIIIFKNYITKINIEKIKEYITHLNNIKLNTCILIYSGAITPMALKLVKLSSNINIQLFTIQELQYNITKHRLVPGYEKLKLDESKEFKEKYGIKFPVMLTKDPICRFYDFKRGDIVKITDKYSDNEIIRYRIIK